MINKKALTLSIVIPVYNEQDYLEDCLEAIKKQSVLPEEVIIVDNNSTDKTLEIARSYPFVRLFEEPKQGVLFARNRGFDEAKSEIIGRIDADTLLPPNWVEKVKQSFNDKHISAVTGPVSYYDMPLEQVTKKIDSSFRTLMSKSRSFVFLFGSNMAIRRQVWQSVRPKLCTSRQIYEDMDLAIHLRRAHHKILYTNAVQARISSRRLDDAPLNFYRYLQLYQKTFEKHRLATPLSKIPALIFMSFYMIGKPMRYLYDEDKKRVSMKKVLKPRRRPARKHPMTKA